MAIKTTKNYSAQNSVPQSPIPRPQGDTYSYKGWLNSDSFMKRAFSIYGYMMVAGLIISIPIYIIMIIMMMFVFSQIQFATRNLPANYYQTYGPMMQQQQPVRGNQPLNINQPAGNVTCEAMYQEIEDDIARANYCQADSDCGTLLLGGWYIDFGCYHYINKAVDQNQFFTKMEAYKQQCSKMINDCASAPTAKCLAGKCVGADESQ